MVLMWVGVITLTLVPWNAWLFATAAMYCLIGIAVSVVYHKQITHAALSMPKWLSRFFMLVGCASMNASPFHWSIVHINHHAKSDTDQDPHPKGIHALFQWKNPVLKVPAHSLKMLRDPFQKFLTRHSFHISLVWAAIVSVLFGWQGFVYIYLIPPALHLMAGAFHTMFAHGKDGPRDLPYMEFLIPLFGEWFHGHHHKKPKDPRFGWFDIGYTIFGRK
jgi:stearoyl-CoA desaturase (Delta-9 desaturase)